ncbi:MAG TPA: hypothetical protein ENG00_01255, partial [Candidatus Aenigmarchaeota archaeon]|nr:hypothetical protein [Candidatus Aenigmarchaeota archaeon]
MYKMVEKLEWGPLATFVPNKKEPVYNWFYYKEGFARGLVLNLLKQLHAGKGHWVLDPFCGVGTTMLACRESGVNSIGFDVHPVSVFVSMVKTRRYDTGILKEEAKRILRMRFERPVEMPRDSLFRRAFKRQTLEDAVFFRDEIMRIENGDVRDFFMLALMNVTMKCSYVYKDGAVLKFRKKPVPPLRDMLRRQVFRMIRDIEGFRTEKCETIVGFGDARKLKLRDETIDFIITSPPYLNKIEYSKIYEIEQRLFLDFVQEKPPIRSYIGLERVKGGSGLENILGEEAQNLPEEAKPYFLDMHRAISEMWRVCRK